MWLRHAACGVLVRPGGRLVGDRNSFAATIIRRRDELALLSNTRLKAVVTDVQRQGRTTTVSFQLGAGEKAVGLPRSGAIVEFGPGAPDWEHPPGKHSLLDIHGAVQSTSSQLPGSGQVWLRGNGRCDQGYRSKRKLLQDYLSRISINPVHYVAFKQGALKQHTPVTLYLGILVAPTELANRYFHVAHPKALDITPSWI